jgi:hypothetical protein
MCRERRRNAPVRNRNNNGLLNMFFTTSRHRNTESQSPFLCTRSTGALRRRSQIEAAESFVMPRPNG